MITAKKVETHIGIAGAAFQRQHELLEKPRDLLGGLPALQAKRERYLPRKSAESVEEYNYRLTNSTLDNYFDHTMTYLQGQVFQKPVIYQDVEADNKKYDKDFFDAFKEDVDLSGNSLTSFAMKLFESAVVDGVCFVLVDYHKVKLETGPDGTQYYVDGDGIRKAWTVDVEKEAGVRPYFVLIPAERVLDAWYDAGPDNKPYLRYFRYMEEAQSVADPDDPAAYLERGVKRRVRVFYPGKWELYESVKDGKYSLIDNGQSSFAGIPIFWFMPGKALSVQSLTATPPMIDLAFANIKHYNALSRHDHLMEWMRSPVWFGVNLVDDEGEQLPFGPSRILNTRTHGDEAAPGLQNVALDPNSVLMSLKDLEKIEDFMRTYGTQIALSPAGYTATATGVNTAANANDSKLKKWVADMVDVIENALKAAAQYKGGTDGPSVDINTNFRQTFDPQKANNLKIMRNDGDLSRRTYLAEQQKLGAFTDEIKVDDEIKQIAKETEAEAGMMTPLAFRDFAGGPDKAADVA